MAIRLRIRAASFKVLPMTEEKRSLWPKFCAVVFMLAFFFQSFTAMQMESDTWDEGLAIASDVLRLFQNSWVVADYAPPLHTWLNAPGLRLLNPSIPPMSALGRGESYFGAALLYRYNDASALLFVCRLSVLLVSCGMGWILYRWASRLGSPACGAFAVFLMAVEPNLLTHSRLATWDMLCTATLFAASYAVWSWLQKPSWGRAVWSGLAVGLALISKYTALLLLPILIVFIISARGHRLGFHFVIMSALALAVVWISYWPDRDPFHYVRGLAQVYQMGVPATGGHYLYYVMGTVYDAPQKIYYLMTFLLKTPIPLLILFFGSLIFRSRLEIKWRDLAFVTLPIGVLSLSAAFDTYNFCLRRVLPVYPFVILLAAQTVRIVRRQIPGAAFIWRLGVVLLGSMAGWLAMSAVCIFPYHLSYFNESVGGPSRGIHYLDECNVDWGQGLPRLATYMGKKKISEVRMGAEDAGPFDRPLYYGVTYHVLSNEEYRTPLPAVYAFSAHRLVWLKKRAYQTGDTQLDWMTRFKPTGHIGHSIYLFDFRSL